MPFDMRDSWNNMASFELWLPFQTSSDRCRAFFKPLSSHVSLSASNLYNYDGRYLHILVRN